MKTHIILGGIVVNTIMASVQEAQQAFPEATCVPGDVGSIGWRHVDGQLQPPVAVAADLVQLRLAKEEQINAWRKAANLSTFPHAGKQVACDSLSRSDIDGVANHIALFGTFPQGFPGAWRAVDKSVIPLPDVDAFRAMYASMTAQGTANFDHSESLKLQLALADTPDEIEQIEW